MRKPENRPSIEDIIKSDEFQLKCLQNRIPLP